MFTLKKFTACPYNLVWQEAIDYSSQPCNNASYQNALFFNICVSKTPPSLANHLQKPSTIWRKNPDESLNEKVTGREGNYFPIHGLISSSHPFAERRCVAREKLHLEAMISAKQLHTYLALCHVYFTIRQEFSLHSPLGSVLWTALLIFTEMPLDFLSNYRLSGTHFTFTKLSVYISVTKKKKKKDILNNRKTIIFITNKVFLVIHIWRRLWLNLLLS